jgi:hypothetical protein
MLYALRKAFQKTCTSAIQVFSIELYIFKIYLFMAIEDLFNRVSNCLLDAHGKGRCIHLIVKFSQNLVETTKNLIRAYPGSGCNSGVDQTSLCGMERVVSEAASKGHGVVMSAGGSHTVIKRCTDLLSAGKSHIIPKAGGVSHIIIVDSFILSASKSHIFPKAGGKSHIDIVKWCIDVGGEEWLGFVLRPRTL